MREAIQASAPLMQGSIRGGWSGSVTVTWCRATRVIRICCYGLMTQTRFRRTRRWSPGHGRW